jgi:hypothetical protein
MYWYKITKWTGFVWLCGIIMCCSACKPDIKETGATLKYFDLKGFLNADTTRLNKLNPTVIKTVGHNGSNQTKKVKIDNWGRELGLFMDADINKPAWQNSYNITQDSSTLIYTAKDPALKMAEMVIKRHKQKVKWIMILNNTSNILYTSSERLTYYPDSLYLIQKGQHVRLMGNNFYRIEGKIEH